MLKLRKARTSRLGPQAQASSSRLILTSRKAIEKNSIDSSNQTSFNISGMQGPAKGVYKFGNRYKKNLPPTEVSPDEY